MSIAPTRGQCRPTRTHDNRHGQQRPTQANTTADVANDGQHSPTRAHDRQHRPTHARKSQHKPTRANESTTAGYTTSSTTVPTLAANTSWWAPNVICFLFFLFFFSTNKFFPFFRFIFYSISVYIVVRSVCSSIYCMYKSVLTDSSRTTTGCG